MEGERERGERKKYVREIGKCITEVEGKRWKLSREGRKKGEGKKEESWEERKEADVLHAE